MGFLAIALVLLVAIAGGTGLYLAYDHITRPGQPGPEVAVDIPEGATGRQVARLLAAEGLVEHELLFRGAIRLDDSRKSLKHGHYEMPTGLSPMEVLHILQEGPSAAFKPGEVPDELKVTIPEGLTIQQMAERFEDPAAFIEAASDPYLLGKLGVDAPTLEGFLMPDTFFFDKKPTERAVVERMFAHFEEVLDELLAEHVMPEGFTLLELVTVASLVEEEARVENERPIIAGVVYNRLERGMPLELDATLQYALGKYGQRMLYEDVETESPYNTYRNKGLPPGPISNPGRRALRAALDPADVDYIFFVSNADGMTHTFSTNLRDHNKAVARYRREMREQRRALQRVSGEG